MFNSLLKNFCIYFCIFFISIYTNAQQLNFGKKIVDTLTSSYFWGRGYTKNGMQKAAEYIAQQFKTYGLTTLNNKEYFQPFMYDVNTFPGKMELTINNKILIPGKDFIVSPNCKGLKAKGNLYEQDTTLFINEKNHLIISLINKLTWSVSAQAANDSRIEVNKNALTNLPKSFKVNIENSEVKNFNAANICAMVKGTSIPDSFIFITAHYDHLGGMGKDTYFPGANDNASGISLLLNLAHYYATHPQKYSIGFICFAGEEAGLKGSKYYTQNPLIPLKNIRFLINTDLAGTGDDGITIVNATEFPKEYDYMIKINNEYHLLPKIVPRGKAANSDHYFFTEKGVPSFFFYTMGGISAYHDVFDVAATLPLNKHEELFKLITKFNEKLMGE